MKKAALILTCAHIATASIALGNENIYAIKKDQSKDFTTLNGSSHNPEPIHHPRLAMLFESLSGAACAGIIDPSNQESIILNIGENKNGFELLRVNLEKSEALFRKNGHTFRLTLCPDSNESDKTESTEKEHLYLRHRRSLLERIGPPQDTSLAELPANLSGTELRKYAVKIQMDAIRRGDPPFPHLPFTLDMDLQLIEEGILPIP